MPIPLKIGEWFASFIIVHLKHMDDLGNGFTPYLGVGSGLGSGFNIEAF